MTRKLKVMMFTWEFPPRIIGGIAKHVYYLSKSLTTNGVKVYVVTCDFPGAPSRENIDGVKVFRIDSYKNPAPDFASWVYLMNMNMQKEAATIVRKLASDIDVFHAHDWLVANAAIGLKHIFRKPLLTTIHSTEVGRRDGIHFDYERMIHQTEAWVTYEAWKVICCSEYMVSHTRWAFGLPLDKLFMIPNGVDIETYSNGDEDLRDFRAEYALPEERIVLFVGRLVYEKGVHILINAASKILDKVDVRFVVVGDGYLKERLIKDVKTKKLEQKIIFTGFVDDETRRKLQKIADVSAVPSLFEPFGIVALEAMAAKSPVVASDTGGLSEIVEHNRTGVKVYPDNPESLSWGITRVLSDKDLANHIRRNAFHKVQRIYNWDTIAQQTKGIYKGISEEYSKCVWR